MSETNVESMTKKELKDMIIKKVLNRLMGSQFDQIRLTHISDRAFGQYERTSRNDFANVRNLLQSLLVVDDNAIQKIKEVLGEHTGQPD